MSCQALMQRNWRKYSKELLDEVRKKIQEGLKDVYKDYDMLNPQNGQLLMSERLIDEFEKRSVSGYKIVTGGCYYETVGFHEPSSGDM